MSQAFWMLFVLSGFCWLYTRLRKSGFFGWTRITVNVPPGKGFATAPDKLVLPRPVAIPQPPRSPAEHRIRVGNERIIQEECPEAGFAAYRRHQVGRRPVPMTPIPTRATDMGYVPPQPPPNVGTTAVRPTTPADRPSLEDLLQGTRPSLEDLLQGTSTAPSGVIVPGIPSEELRSDQEPVNLNPKRRIQL